MTESNFPLLLLEQNKHAINKKQSQGSSYSRKAATWSLGEGSDIPAVDHDDRINW